MVVSTGWQAPFAGLDDMRQESLQVSTQALNNNGKET